MRCFDPTAAEAMIAEVKAAAKDGDSLGGVVEVLAYGVPVGLGSLSVEAEAIGPEGAQKAAMVWARGASSLTQARMSNEGDAYDLAAEFGADFAKLLVTGATPFGGVPQLPTIETIRTRMGGAPKYTACESYGRFPGLAGVVGGGLGLPPNMADKGAPTQPSSVAEASR